ncbi:TRNA (guanine-N(7)-)-methyltransferase [Actinidia chinensis var. chinensis]|uniref:tRNA (Guanine-N(7)-)-methyltransferase n=1 Tax=Actinidia chinensis var. chinensis TaxID=1590841 RepID=A0A2R6QXQ8_ACTCC|nr:TRNA (guanine-N(7)-)-methyltransferase [Actinidia chinensis var. chinensis]
MTALSNYLVCKKHSAVHLSPGSPLKSVNQCLGSSGSKNLSFSRIQTVKTQCSTSRRALTVQAGYSDGGRRGSAGIFIGGFVLGGIVVGALGCAYAPQLSKALAGTDKKDLMKKLPKFIYDEEKAMEKTRKLVEDKIAQLNSDLDDISSRFRSEDAQNEVTVDANEIQDYI